MSNKLCFVAVVRDESPVIERCLSSIRNIATSYLICDTGSKDDTIKKIQEYMKSAKIPGEVIETEWVSYGDTKTYLLQKFREHPLVGNAEYFCWLDADEVFIMDKNNYESYPTKEDAKMLYDYLDSRKENVFMLTSLYGNIIYKRWQIARNNQVYEWRLPYQEYFIGTKDNTQHTIEFMFNYARHEGNSSRDPEITKKRVIMSEKWLERNSKDPNDTDYTRMLFYIAEAYSKLEGLDENGKSYKEKAIETYKKRLEVGGFYQEKYISLLRMSKLVPDYEKLALYLRATEICPERLEAFYELMMYYYNKGQHDKAAALGFLAPKSRVPPAGSLFVTEQIYTYRFDMNWSVSCYYSGNYEKALELGKYLNEKEIKVDSGTLNTIKSNLKFFLLKVKPEAPILRNEAIKHLPTIMVIDNFYEDPDTVRANALKMGFGVKGNYPGERTQSIATDADKKLFENILGRKITYWPNTYNGSFQYTLAEHKSWIHRDKTDFSAVIYLTPNAPLNGGTCIWRHKDTKLERTTTEDEEKRLNDDGNDESKWDLVDRIGNKYNRAIIFQGKISHKSDRYFGTGIETGRLFQTFFFNVEGC
jgi:tetratricopeptide (TPR) repeat protein